MSKCVIFLKDRGAQNYDQHFSPLWKAKNVVERPKNAQKSNISKNNFLDVFNFSFTFYIFSNLKYFSSFIFETDLEEGEKSCTKCQKLYTNLSSI